MCIRDRSPSRKDSVQTITKVFRRRESIRSTTVTAQRLQSPESHTDSFRKRKGREALIKFVFPRQLIGRRWRTEDDGMERYVVGIGYHHVHRDTCLYCLPYADHREKSTTQASTNLILYDETNVFDYDYVRTRVQCYEDETSNNSTRIH